MISSAPPSAMAAWGMAPYWAVFGSWAMVRPPAARMARLPWAPSEPVPDRTTPAHCSPRWLARLLNSVSMEGLGPIAWDGVLRRSSSPLMVRSALGGQT